MKPNIIYLHSHDTGRYIQPYGYAIDTPHMQRFAEQGTLFRNAFCAGPTCSPSRAALVTGQAPHSSGMMGLAHRGWSLTDYKQHLVHTLSAAGYDTALCGTQHVAGKSAGGVGAIGYDQVLNPDAHDGQAGAVGAFFQGRTDQSKPFFLAIGYGLTHRTGNDENNEQWHNGKESPVGDPRYVRPPACLPDTPETRRDFADYAQCAKRLDAEYGQILQALDDTGLADNTLVIITTDHGIAYPHMKCNLTDHGMGVLLMMRGPSQWADRFNTGKVIDGMVSHIDIFPTLCELLDITPPSWLQGKSVVPLLRDEAEQINDAVFSEVTFHAAYEPKRAVRTTRYKYIRRFDTDLFPDHIMPNCDNSISKSLLYKHGWADRPRAAESLFDLMFDPNEANDLASDPAMATVLQEMRGRLDAWMKQTDDPLLQGQVAPRPGDHVTPQDNYDPSNARTVV
jgi:N-sulfoglucosamine sulfohydrolase